MDLQEECCVTGTVITAP